MLAPRSAHLNSYIGRTAMVLLLAGSFAGGAQAAGSQALSARTQPASIAIVGDSVANDLGRGMEALFDGKHNVQVIKQTRFATGLVRTDHFNWNTTVRDFLKQQNPDAIVVVIGGNDRQPIRTGGKRFEPLSKSWLAEYERRVAHFMNAFKRARAKIYWVGLPAVRSDKLSVAYRAMNAIYKRQAARHGFTFVSIWDKFLTPAGAYSSFGQSMEGVKRQLRKDDGMHFTEAGRLLLAAHVARTVGLR